MRTVEAALREFGEALDLPTRRKLVLLREVRADFEGAVATFVAGGSSLEEAHVRALGLLSPTVEDARSLTGLHRTAYAQAVGRLPRRVVRLMERGSVAGMAVIGAFSPALVLTRVSDLPPGAALLFGCVSLLVLSNLAWHAFRLFVRQDLDASALARASVIQAGLIALTLTVGLVIVTIQAYGLFGSWGIGDAPGVVPVAETVLAVAETTAVVLAITVLGFVGGAVLLQCLSPIREAERELEGLLESADTREEIDA